MLLFVNLLGDEVDDAAIGREVAADFDGPEKIVLWNDEPMPPLFSLTTGPEGGVLTDTSAVERGLDRAAAGEPALRSALDVLLKGRIADDEVEHLINLLAEGPGR